MIWKNKIRFIKTKFVLCCDVSNNEEVMVSSVCLMAGHRLLIELICFVFLPANKSTFLLKHKHFSQFKTFFFGFVYLLSANSNKSSFLKYRRHMENQALYSNTG